MNHGQGGTVGGNAALGGGGGGAGARPAPPKALERQIGGDHYKGVSIQPVEVAWAWQLDFPDGSMLKYLFRWATLRNPQDLEKLRHWAEMILEHAEQTTPNTHVFTTSAPRS